MLKSRGVESGTLSAPSIRVLSDQADSSPPRNVTCFTNDETFDIFDTTLVSHTPYQQGVMEGHQLRGGDSAVII
jgi:hypothetical protein